jgi:hypothetical protein
MELIILFLLEKGGVVPRLGLCFNYNGNRVYLDR